MNVLVRAEVLAVGVGEYVDHLQRLPIRLVDFETGKEAVGSLKNKKFNAVISKWNLPDMLDGKLLKGIKLIKPDMPTIAMVEAENFSQEVSARSAGMTAVVSDIIDTQQLNVMIATMLRIPVYIPETANSI